MGVANNFDSFAYIHSDAHEWETRSRDIHEKFLRILFDKIILKFIVFKVNGSHTFD